MQHIISGIQQIGIGVNNACEAFQWYKQHFGFDTIVFEDKAAASLMTRYTGGKEHERYAVLAMNMQGGAGLEIWQYTSRAPQPAEAPLCLGDTGIFSVKLRCKDVEKAYSQFSIKGLNLLTGVSANPVGELHFYVEDLYGNIFEIVEEAYWFSNNKNLIGGICGATIGVNDLKNALPFYQNILGYRQVDFDGEDLFKDLNGINGGLEKIKRVILKQSKQTGPFSRLLGPSVIELVQATNRTAKKIYAERYWGDPGFIHICYDVCGMEQLSVQCNKLNSPFTVNSIDSFSMGQAGGHFAYNEDYDGTLIEYVETHKVPIVKKLGWYLDLRKRNSYKPLPDWMIKCMGLGKKELQLAS
ncbi:MAG TPA: VOC family protein [Flavisolibacter sp.]|nr:VOC family protein [Flavisolibacter sp.]